MAITLTITDSLKTIQKNINGAIADLANEIITKNINQISNSVRSLIPNWILSQPEIISLSSNTVDSLVGIFGIADSTQSIIDSIINSVVSSTEIKHYPYSKNLKGGLEIRFQPSNFSNLLSLPDGHTKYIGGDLHWLDWLLKRGDSIIVVNYQYNPQTGFGRSGLGNMIPGGSFRIPPQFSGTVDNNFITRAFIGPTQEKQISYILQKIFN